MQQLLSALACLHEQGVCHRDLKPDNLIIDLNSESFKLIDFNTAIRTAGSSQDYPKDIWGGIGLKQWSAPETRTSRNYSAKCDSFSAGCILYYLLTKGQQPDLSGDKAIEEAEEFVKETQDDDDLMSLIMGLMN